MIFVTNSITDSRTGVTGLLWAFLGLLLLLLTIHTPLTAGGVEGEVRGVTYRITEIQEKRPAGWVRYRVNASNESNSEGTLAGTILITGSGNRINGRCRVYLPLKKGSSGSGNVHCRFTGEYAGWRVEELEFYPLIIEDDSNP